MEPPHGCPAAETSLAMALLQERWMLSLLDILLEGEQHFNDLARLLSQASPTTLQSRLKTLVARGLVLREVRRVVPPSTLYRLTPRGETVRPLIQSMRQWCAEHHSAPPEGASAEQSPVVQVLRVLGQKWSLPIMMLLSLQERGFTQLMESLGPINSSTLKSRLDQLQELGFVERQVLPGTRLRTLYRVTGRGKAFRQVMLVLQQWEQLLEG